MEGSAQVCSRVVDGIVKNGGECVLFVVLPYLVPALFGLSDFLGIVFTYVVF